jgi:hypothetical protein
VTRALVAVFAVAALAASTALADPQPDAHDSALAARLAAKVNTFKQVAQDENGGPSLKQSLNDCPLMKKDPSQAFAAVFALLPAVLTQMVNDFGPQLRDVQQTLLSMHPHSHLFQRWVTASQQSFTLLLRFDNHGKKVDLCQAATVMLDKHSTAADIHDVLGIDPALIPKLFQSSSTATVTKLDPQMRTFFRAAGLSRADAKTLTS